MSRGMDCITCMFAHRDKHNRYIDSCAGYGNCAYEEFEGKVDPTPIEQMQELIDKASDKNFKAGVLACIEILENE